MKLKTLLLSLVTVAVSLTTNAQLTKENFSRYYTEFKEIFTDGSCSELKLPYSAMSDEELITYFWEFPQELVDIAIKVKNNAWAPREKEFRIAEYEPHGNTYSWSNYLRTNPYSYLQNPTGISATTGDTLLIFVGDELPSGLMLKLIEVINNDALSDYYVYDAEKFLSRGANLITVTQPDAMLFIGYAVGTDTTATSKKLADYGNVKVHIEGGKVNGYFDARRHTDEDWRDMLANHFEHYSVQVRGERVIFQMAKEDIEKVCPNTVTDAIGWWDQCVAWQHELMGVDKYYDRWNALMMARSGHDDSYMYATHYYTYYEYSTLKDILPWATVYANPGFMWGPAHEIGHMNQGAINIVSCTEASNNLFSNVQIHRAGKTTTRGVGVADCRNDFKNSTAFPLRGNVIGKSRMFFQLYLYFHAAGKDTTFYPRLFEALRQDPIVKGYYTDANNDQLKFAEKCCEVAQMDLSEFFDAWGFFKPMEQANVGDYGTFLVTLTQKDAEESRTRMQQYEKKGGHLIFIEDRIKPSKRTDGADGYRLDFSDEFPIGKMGDLGQWEDYIDESINADGYFFSRSSNNITIKKTDKAKGALGFKLLNAETGELLDFNNSFQLTVPVAHANAPIKVVAAQANGEDYVVPNILDSEDEEMLLEALNATLSTANALMSKKTTTGKEIGYFYSNALTELKTLYNEAKAAADNKDTSKHSYKEWIDLLEEEMDALKNDPSARALLKELDVYTLTNLGKRTHNLCYDRLGLKANTSQEMANTMPDKRWLFESAGVAHCYYIKNKNGLYINDIGIGTSCSGSSKDAALVFKANYLDNGTVYFTTQNDEIYLTLDINSNLIFAGNTLLNAATWSIRCVEQNNTGIEEVKTENEKRKGVYDLQGREVKTENGKLKGFYIIDGKKFLVK